MSEKRNVIVRIAGAAGDGIASTGELFGKPAPEWVYT